MGPTMGAARPRPTRRRPARRPPRTTASPRKRKRSCAGCCGRSPESGTTADPPDWPGSTRTGELLFSAAMTKPKLIYFDAPVSRGEECRLALHLAGVDFEDVRIKPADWPAMKPQTPYGGMPILELPGQPPLAQSNAILVL